MKKYLSIAALAVGLTLMTGLASPLGVFRAYQISCTSTAASIKPSDGSNSAALTLWNPSATAIYIGGSDVDTSTKGLPICNTSSCYSDKLSIDGNVAGAFCVSGGTVTVTVLRGR